MDNDNSELWIIAQESAKFWPYPSASDFLEVSFDAQLAIVRRMVNDSRAKAGWVKLSRHTKNIRDKQWFCGSVLRQIITIYCSYAISRREGTSDRADRFEKIIRSLSEVERNLDHDREFFREYRLAVSEKNSKFADQLKQAMEPHFKRLAPESKFIDVILLKEVFNLLDDNPFSILDLLKVVVKRLAEMPPLTTKMNLEESNEIYFQKRMTHFWEEQLGKPLYGVTADFSSAIFGVAITEDKVRGRVKKK